MIGWIVLIIIGIVMTLSIYGILYFANKWYEAICDELFKK